MKKLLLYTVLLFSAVCGYAQNLVPNFGFDIHDTCPNTGDQIQYAIGWSKYSNLISTPDYYNACAAPSTVGIPQSYFMYQPDRRGCGAYVGLVTWTTNPNEREHVGIQLSSPLVIGQKYFISFYTVMGGSGGSGDTTWYYESPSNNIGLRLSTVSYSPSFPSPIDNFAHLRSTLIITDTLNWVRISGSIIADSAYQYLAVGNFFDDLNTNTTTLSCGNCTNSYSYYLVDDICISTDSLFANGGMDALPCTVGIGELNPVSEFSVFPNPTSGLCSMSLYQEEIKEVCIYDFLGKVVLNKKEKSNLVSIDLSEFPDGIYIIKIITKNNASTAKKIIKSLKQ